MGELHQLPIETCPVCTKRIRPNEVTIRDKGQSIHADGCWQAVLNVRNQPEPPKASVVPIGHWYSR